MKLETQLKGSMEKGRNPHLKFCKNGIAYQDIIAGKCPL